MIIRPYQTEDRAACKRVYFRAVREGAAAFYSEGERAAWAASPEPDMTQPDKLLDQWTWVSEDSGKVTGFMSLRRDGYLDMAFVLPEVMGQGVAAALFQALMQRAEAEGLSRLTVHASHLFRRFLLRRGWVVDQVEHIAIGEEQLERFCMSWNRSKRGFAHDLQIP